MPFLRRASWRDWEAPLRSTGRRIRSTTGRGLARVSELLFPPQCLLCGEETGAAALTLCGPCRGGLISQAPACPRCARPLPEHFSPDAAGCPQCHDTRWRFARAAALGPYAGLVRDLVLRIKKPRFEALCGTAGRLLAEQLAERWGGRLPDRVLPVPMHWTKRLLRGTNASEVLAESVAKRLRIPRADRLIRCIRPTRKQGTLMPRERQLNVRGAFALRRSARLTDQHLLIVDDVLTTGATANEVAKTLLQAGAREVSIGVIARGQTS